MEQNKYYTTIFGCILINTVTCVNKTGKPLKGSKCGIGLSAPLDDEPTIR